MAHEYLRELVLSGGFVTGGAFHVLEDDDLPRLSPDPSGTHVAVTVDQWGRVTGAATGEPLGLGNGGTGSDLSATGPGFVLQAGVGAPFTVDTTTSLVLAVGGLTVNGSANFNDTLTVALAIYDSTATTSLDFSTPGQVSILGGFFAGDGSGLTNLPAGSLTGTVALSHGGTGSDLSATGPGFVYQASAGAALSVVTTVADAVTFAGGLSAKPSAAGTGNEVYGSGAGVAITSGGQNNTVLGNSAGSTLTTGDNNTILGFQAGGNLTTGSENTIIGSQLVVSAATSSTVAIGRSHTLTGSSRAVAMGVSVTVSHDDCVALGVFAVSSKNGQFVTGTLVSAWTLTQDSTVQQRPVAEVQREWVDSTDASRKGRMKLGAYATTVWGEGLRLEADGTRCWAGVPAGTSSSFARVGGTIFDHYADAGNSTTTETDLVSDTIASSTLASNGDKLEGEYGGVYVSSATATRQIKLYFAGTAIFDTGALTLSLSSAWTMYVTLIRVSATVMRYMISFTTEGAALAAYTAVGELTGLTLSNSNILKVTGQAAGVGAASNDIVSKMASVAWRPAAA